MSARPGLFVTGTDTGVGKTVVAAAIASSLRAEGRQVGALKPVATGAERPGDADHLIAALGGAVAIERVAPIRLTEPLAPPVAARRSGTPLSFARVKNATIEAIAWWEGPGEAEILIVEGVGGLLCPLAEGATVADLAVALDYPLLIVARRGLGTLNHTLLTVEAARRRALRVAGLILNGAGPTVDPLAEATNPAELVRHLDGIPLLAEIPHGALGGDLVPAFAGIDWFARAARPRRE